MNEQRRTLAYFLLVLLILLVVAIIGGLSAVLFNMKPALPHPPEPVPVEQPDLLTNRLEQGTPVAETLIEIPPEKAPPPRRDALKPQSTGVIPTVCDGYGPQIQDRKAYWGPVTYETQVNPNRVRFKLNLADSQPTEGPNNIR
jgi:hypothetical protein